MSRVPGHRIIGVIGGASLPIALLPASAAAVGGRRPPQPAATAHGRIAAVRA